MPGFVAGPPRLIATPADRFAVGLDHWPDGSIGVVRRRGRNLAFASNGGRVVRHTLGSRRRLVDPASVEGRRRLLTPTRVGMMVEDQRVRSDYAAGGPAFYDRSTDQLLVWYHGETHTDGDPERFYSFIGMAASGDGGRSFRDLGRIVRPRRDEHSLDPGHDGVELGPGAFVIVDGWCLVFFSDHTDEGKAVHLGVARCRWVDVLGAAASGVAPVFRKWFEGAFTEPALGGRASEVLPPRVFPVHWLDVLYSEALSRLVLVYSAQWCRDPSDKAGADAPSRWMHFVATSADGIDWSRPEPLYEDWDDEELLFVSLLGDDPAAPRSVRGDRFDLIRTASPTGGHDRWASARVEAVTVRIEH